MYVILNANDVMEFKKFNSCTLKKQHWKDLSKE